MTDEVPDAVARAFVEHGAFEEDTDGYDCTTTAFDATVRAARDGDATASAGADGDATAFEVRVTLPTLSAAVDGEVAAVVEDGWYETLERRVADAFDVARVEGEAAPAVERDGDEVRVAMAFRTGDPARAVADAKALIDYVEGTYVQGVIPGYDYRDPVRGLLQRAREAGDGGDEAAGRGGTPL